MPILVSWQNQINHKVRSGEIKSHLDSVLLALGYPGTVNIEVVLVDDEEIKKLNNKYLNQDKPTDILSFPANQTPGQDLLGSLIISIETATKQAKDAGVTITDEIKMLSSHGLLHLLDFHHK